MYYPKDLVNRGGKVKKATCLSFHSMWLCCDNALYRPVHHLWAQVREALWPDQLGDTGQTMMNSASVDLARRISDLPVEQLWDNHIFLLSIFFFFFLIYFGWGVCGNMQFGKAPSLMCIQVAFYPGPPYLAPRLQTLRKCIPSHL